MMARMIALICVLAVLGTFVRAGDVIGIDLGIDTLKIGIVQSGRPLDIVTNFQAKRKTPSTVAFFKGIRQYGSDATALHTRSPSTTFPRIPKLLGHSASHPEVKELIERSYFPLDIFTNATDGVLRVAVPDATETVYYTGEELTAMLLSHVRAFTADYTGGNSVRDCVITVPASFTQAERESVLIAASLADLNVLSLIEDNTAAALQYTLDRQFSVDEPTHVLYYNFGAGSIEVSIVAHGAETVKSKTVNKFEVLGKAYDSHLSTTHVDDVLVNLLADRFNALWKEKKKSPEDFDVRDVPRALARLRNEAVKVKEVLSANTEFPFRIESLHGDLDLSFRFTRAELEDAITHLLSRMAIPIKEAIEMSGLSLSDINAVEMLGGGVRMPSVRRALEEFFSEGNVPVGQHLNGDEATALGASFRGAALSTSFRPRQIGITDINTMGVSLRLETLGDSEEESKSWKKSAEIFPPKSTLSPKPKKFFVDYDKDIVATLYYTEGTPLPEGTDPLLATYSITGMKEFLAEVTEKGITAAPKIQLNLNLDGSGIARLLKAEAFVELPTTEENANTEDSADSEEKPVEDKKTDKKNKKADKKEENVLRRSLTVTLNTGVDTPSKWTPALFKDARDRLRVLQDADDLRAALGSALNDLESYIYRVKGRLSEEEDALSAVSTEEQRTEVIDLANELEDWLYEKDSESRLVITYTNKKNELRRLAEPIFQRFDEIEAREKAVAKARESLNNLRKNIADWPTKMPHITEEETEGLLASAAEVEAWLDERIAAQAAASPYEKPVFASAEVVPRLKTVASQYKALSKKPKPVVVENTENVEEDTKEEEPAVNQPAEDQQPGNEVPENVEDANEKVEDSADSPADEL